MTSRVLRRSTVVVIAIVRNRLCDATAAATVQHCRRSSSQPHASSLALSGTRGTTAATVQRRRSSQPHAPSLALSRTRSTTAATVQRRSSSQPRAPSLALSGTRGTTAATVQRRRSSQPHAPSLALSGTRGTTAATVQLRSSSQSYAPSLALSGTRGTTAATVQRGSSSQALYRHGTSDGCNHLAGPSHRQPSLSRTRPLRSGFSRTIWRCRCSPSRRDRSSRRRRQ